MRKPVAAVYSEDGSMICIVNHTDTGDKSKAYFTNMSREGIRQQRLAENAPFLAELGSDGALEKETK